MTVKLPTIDYNAAQKVLAADNNNVSYDDLTTLDSQTVSTAAVNLLKARQATNPTDSDQLQGEIDAINSGSMPAGQVQQILRSASSSELTNALFQTTYGISEAQFQQGAANGTLGSQYGLTPSEISSMSSVMGSSNTKLIGSLAQAGTSPDSMSGNSASIKPIVIGVSPVSSGMSLGDFISAFVAAIDSVLMSQNKTNEIDAASSTKRINDVIQQAKDRIATIQMQTKLQVDQINSAIKQIKAAKLLQEIIAIVVYVITVIITVAASVASLGTATPAAVALGVLIDAVTIAALTVFFTMQMKDIAAKDGLNWEQRAANKKYGADSSATSAADAAKMRQQKQRYESMLGMIQTIIDVVTAVLSLGVSGIGSAAAEAAEQSAKAIMTSIMSMIKALLRELMTAIKLLIKPLMLALMVGGGAINAMLSSGELQDLMARNSAVMQTYDKKFTSDAVQARYNQMRGDPQYASLSDSELKGYATTEQSLINSGDTAGLAELYARREAYEQGTTTTINVSNLHSGDALGALSTYQQNQLMNRASADIHQRTLDSQNGYETAMNTWNQNNQGLIMGLSIAASIATMAGGAGLGGGKGAQGAASGGRGGAKAIAQKVGKKVAEDVAKETAKAAEEAAEEAAKAAKEAARLMRAQKIANQIQTVGGVAQSAAQTTQSIYSAENDRKTIKNQLAINEKQRQFDLMFAIEDLATQVLTQLKDDIMEIETRSLDSAKKFNAAIASAWQGLEASFNAASAKKN